MIGVTYMEDFSDEEFDGPPTACALVSQSSSLPQGFLLMDPVTYASQRNLKSVLPKEAISADLPPPTNATAASHTPVWTPATPDEVAAPESTDDEPCISHSAPMNVPMTQADLQTVLAQQQSMAAEIAGLRRQLSLQQAAAAHTIISSPATLDDLDLQSRYQARVNAQPMSKRYGRMTHIPAGHVQIKVFGSTDTWPIVAGIDSYANISLIDIADLPAKYLHLVSLGAMVTDKLPVVAAQHTELSLPRS